MKYLGTVTRTAAAVAAVALVVAGCSRTARMERRLSSDGAVERAAAAESLGVWGASEALASLVEAVGDTVPGVRERVMEAVGRTGGPGEVSVLVGRLLGDSDPGVRDRAAWALSYLAPDTSALILARAAGGPTETIRLRAVCGLTDLARYAGTGLSATARRVVGGALGDVVRSTQAGREEIPGNWFAWDAVHTGSIAPEDTAEVVGDQAAIGLAWLGGAESGAGLMDALRGVAGAGVRDSVLATLAVRNDRLVIDAIVGEMDTRMTSARRHAVDLLGRIPHSVAVSGLLAASEDASGDVRAASWAGLAAVHGVRIIPGVQVVSRPLPMIDAAVTTAANAAATAGEARIAVPAALLLGPGAGDAAVDVLSAHAIDARTPVEWRVAAYTAIESMPVAGPVSARAERAVSVGVRSSSGDVRAAAIRASGRIPFSGREREIRRAFESDDPRIVRAGLIAVRTAGLTQFGADVLGQFVSDSLTRAEAARTMAALAVADRQHMNYLVLVLTNNDPIRRHTAVEGIRVAASRLWAADSLDAYRSVILPAIPWLAQIGRQETSPDYRAHALDALGFVPSHETNEALGLGLDDPSEVVRLSAAVGLVRLRGDVALSSISPLAFRASDDARRRIVHAVGGIDGERAREILRRVSVLDRSWRIRNSARQYLTPGG